MSVLAYLVAVWLFVVGIYGVVTSRHLVHMVTCLSVAQASTYVLLLGIGYRDGAQAPFFSDIDPGTPVVDPIVHLPQIRRDGLQHDGAKAVHIHRLRQPLGDRAGSRHDRVGQPHIANLHAQIDHGCASIRSKTGPSQQTRR